jgi:hypothetical protein
MTILQGASLDTADCFLWRDYVYLRYVVGMRVKSAEAQLRTLRALKRNYVPLLFFGNFVLGTHSTARKLPHG